MYLEEQFHKENPMILDDASPDALDYWYSKLSVDDCIEYGEQYGFEMLKEGTNQGRKL